MKISLSVFTVMAGLASLALVGAAPAVALTPAAPQYGGWNAPPPPDAGQQGFRDGQRAARMDFGAHLPPDAQRHEELRHPPVPPELHMPYRDGFRHGYDAMVRQMYAAAPPQQPAPMPGPMPGGGMELRHRGFQEGMNGALQDMDNHRRPDPNNRDEYRNPPVPPPAAEAYRDGFRHGYGAAMHAMTAMPADWRQGPFGAAHSQGFRDGASGAIRDYDNHRRPDPNNRDEYRHPQMPPPMAEAYRDGFRQGYSQIANELMGFFGRF